MALTREGLERLFRWLDEDQKFRATLRRRLFSRTVILEVRLPTDWMAKVDLRLDSLKKDMGILKSKVFGSRVSHEGSKHFRHDSRRRKGSQ